MFTHVWLALFGLWPWEHVPALPPEIVLLPAWVPLNVYDFACWARQTIVALSLVMAHRPRHALPFDLRGAARPRAVDATRGRPRGGARGWRGWTARCASTSAGRSAACARLALARAERWIVRRQEADGSWGGIQPPWVYSLMALHLRGYPLDHPVMRRGLRGLDGFMIEDTTIDQTGDGAPAGASRRLEACQSPVWDTALAIVALADAGLPGEHPAIVRAAEWLLDEEVRYAATGRCAGRACSPAAGRSSSPTTTTPTSTTPPRSCSRWAVCSRRARSTAARSSGRARWVEGMQSSGGGWGAFDADNTRALVRELPFLDFGEVIDEPSADVTAHAVEMLAALGLADAPAARAGVRWLLDEQEPDGSWFGRWGVNHVYGTGAAVPALIAAGVAPSELCIRRAVRWLEDHQNEDGGWGEDPRSYDEPAWIGRGPSTASQTAWALLALHAAGERSSALAARDRLAGGHAARRRHVGRAAVHRHGLPVGLLHQLPPLPAHVPGHGARPLSAGRARSMSTAMSRTAEHLAALLAEDRRRRP